jgi:hypothetical protein
MTLAGKTLVALAVLLYATAAEWLVQSGVGC